MRRIGDLPAKQEGARRIARPDGLGPAGHIGPRAADGIEPAHRDKAEGISGGPVLGTERSEAEIVGVQPERLRKACRVPNRADPLGLFGMPKLARPPPRPG